MRAYFRYQKGYLYEEHGAWYVRYRQRVPQEDGSSRLKHISKHLGRSKDFPNIFAVERCRASFMQTVNQDGLSTNSRITITAFVEGLYLPWTKEGRVERRVIRPALEAIGLPWRGGHAFRRALASNLYALGAPDKVVQRVLRHSRPHVTKERYIKVFDRTVLEAAEKMQKRIEELRQTKEPCRQLELRFSDGVERPPTALGKYPAFRRLMDSSLFALRPAVGQHIHHEYRLKLLEFIPSSLEQVLTLDRVRESGGEGGFNSRLDGSKTCADFPKTSDGASRFPIEKAKTLYHRSVAFL